MTAERPRTSVNAWRPSVPGISEVFHAHFTDHAYPVHTHDTWDLMILDDGAVDFALDRRLHAATGTAGVLLLPPGVPHDGRTVTTSGFRKRNLYLDDSVLPQRLVGGAVDSPVLDDELLRHRIHQLHVSLGQSGDEFESECRLSFIRERLHFHLDALRPLAPTGEANRLAGRLRELLDSRIPVGISLHEAAATLHAHPTHLIRCFKQTYGLPPHGYLTGKRIDRARHLLLDGLRPAQVATAVGFHDQAHLNRHFTRHVGTTPGRYRRNLTAPPAQPPPPTVVV
ncbi:MULTISPECIES: AraC family transcriptional regulator [Streptomyces]|uniref:AraC family transcriptional regulator n=1 Tax=Streptomyces cyaneofuscatus TaxID=66883 RepID=A0ABZ1ETQ9_9ACTN|nr:AraC family transcriptional regulator [Streptomyces cyaneofuscatus]WSB07525.1 AraC family transcriptional regulator [Streptomyces cyaneofuscatus]WSD48942.1 AraC family transcriptional regulator [Streptomyces cyaneofuscatus]